MNISIVIPVSNDLRLIRCINSIQVKVEVVISLNKPSKELKEQVEFIMQQQSKGQYKDIHFLVCEIDKPSIAQAYNNGIRHASSEYILLMDSDCIFEKCCIKKLRENLGNNLLSKGRVIFTENSFFSKIVSKAREFHTSDEVNAYSPPLLFKKEISNFIGGYYFHPSLCWLEDSEFDNRVNKAGLEIAYDASATVFHPPLSPIVDLRNAFWYGVGKRIGTELGIHKKPSGFIKSFKKYIIIGSLKKGFIVGLYLYLWKTTLITGYLFQRFFRIRK